MNDVELQISPFPVERSAPRGEKGMNTLSRRTTAQHGFTFVELLVVLILVGLTAVVTIISIRTFLARYQLDTQMTKLSAFLDSVPAAARRNNGPVFLVWQSAASQFVISTDAAGTQVMDSLKIDTRTISITAPSAPVLRCDVMGRVFIGTSTTMMNTVQTITLQHARVNDPSAPVFRLSIPPLWVVMVERV